MYEKFWDSPNFVHQYDFRITLYESRTISALLSAFVLKGNVWETLGKGQLSTTFSDAQAVKVVIFPTFPTHFLLGGQIWERPHFPSGQTPIKALK